MAMHRNVGKFDNALDEAIYGLSLDGGPDDEAGSSTEAPGLWMGLMRDGKGLADAIEGDRDSFPNVTASDLRELRTRAGAVVSERSDGFVSVTYYASASDLERDWKEAKQELEVDDGEEREVHDERGFRPASEVRSARRGERWEEGGSTTSFGFGYSGDDEGDDEEHRKNPDAAYRSIADIRAANKEAGLHFFERDSMRFFNSKVESKVYGGEYFITSEKQDEDHQRRYTVRKALPSGDIQTIGKFQGYNFKEDAADAIRGWIKSGHHPNGRSADPRHQRNLAALDRKKIQRALAYVHYWEARERGDSRQPRAEAAVTAIRAEGLNDAEAEVLRNALNLNDAVRGGARHRSNARESELARSGVLEQLLDMEAESMEPSGRGHVPDEVKGELSFTPELLQLVKDYERALQEALEEAVALFPPEDDASADELFADEAPYLVLMTLRGEGVGIWDGSWDSHYADTDPIQKFLKKKLGRFQDDTGSGKITEALQLAVYEAMRRAEYGFDEDTYVPLAEGGELGVEFPDTLITEPARIQQIVEANDIPMAKFWAHVGGRRDLTRGEIDRAVTELGGRFG